VNGTARVFRVLAVTVIASGVSAGTASAALAAPTAAAGGPAASAALAASAAGPAAAPSTVTVTGTGTASGTPDELQLSLETSITAASASDALSGANQAMTKVKDALTKDGVAASDMQTGGLSVQPQYNTQGSITGYNVSESLTAELHGLDKAGQAITDAVNAGGNAVRVDNVQLDLTDQAAALLASARASAIGDANQRAAQYAKAAGRKLGPVLTITEDSASVPVRPLPFVGAAFAPASVVPISAGTQQVTASVTVVYQLS
jgi:uncharacterized protein